MRDSMATLLSDRRMVKVTHNFVCWMPPRTMVSLRRQRTASGELEKQLAFIEDQ